MAWENSEKTRYDVHPCKSSTQETYAEGLTPWNLKGYTLSMKLSWIIQWNFVSGKKNKIIGE